MYVSLYLPTLILISVFTTINRRRNRHSNSDKKHWTVEGNALLCRVLLQGLVKRWSFTPNENQKTSF